MTFGIKNYYVIDDYLFLNFILYQKFSRMSLVNSLLCKK